MTQEQLIQRSRENQVLDELVGTLKFNTVIQQWKFEFRDNYNDTFVPANQAKNAISIILESPHKAEFEGVNLKSVSLGTVNSRPLNNPVTRGSLHNILNSVSFRSEFNSFLDKEQSYDITLVNAVQFQCSLGEPTEIHRDRVFVLNWIEYQDNFIERIKEIDPILILNCCTKGTWIDNKYLDLERLRSYEVGKYIGDNQLHYTLSENRSDFSLKDLVECKLIVEGLISSSSYLKFDHPSSFNNKELRPIKDSDRSILSDEEIYYFTEEDSSEKNDNSIFTPNEIISDNFTIVELDITRVEDYKRFCIHVSDTKYLTTVVWSKGMLSDVVKSEREPTIEEIHKSMSLDSHLFELMTGCIARHTIRAKYHSPSIDKDLEMYCFEEYPPAEFGPDGPAEGDPMREFDDFWVHPLLEQTESILFYIEELISNGVGTDYFHHLNFWDCPHIVNLGNNNTAIWFVLEYGEDEHMKSTVVHAVRDGQLNCSIETDFLKDVAFARIKIPEDIVGTQRLLPFIHTAIKKFVQESTDYKFESTRQYYEPDLVKYIALEDY